jgi:NADH-quinone oxidoreductase subunit N
VSKSPIWQGLSRRSPWLALVMTVALLSLGGVPPAAAFRQVLSVPGGGQQRLGLACMIGVLNSIVALYYYLVVVKVCM